MTEEFKHLGSEPQGVGPAYRNKTVLVTGGLGFLGSNLARRLIGLGAKVVVIDSLVQGCGGNPANLEGVRASLRVLHQDIGEGPDVPEALRQADIVFNLAGEVSHVHSMLDPSRDLALNTTAQLRFLQACAHWRPGIRIVYAGTRQVFGRPLYLPVDEDHPVRPVDFNGVHKFAAAQYHLMLADTGALDPIVLNLTNVYGPRMSLLEPSQGFLGTYLFRALQGLPLKVFGDGMQLRDPVFVDDVVEAFLIAGAAHQPARRVYNVGGPGPVSLAHIAETLRRLSNGPPVELQPFPPDLKRIDIGSYWTDWSRFHAEFGWRPAIGLEEGMLLTLGFYRRESFRYVGPVAQLPDGGEPAAPASRRTLVASR